MPDTSTEGVQVLEWLDGKVDPVEIVHIIKIWPYHQIVYAQKITESIQDNEIQKILWDFEIKTNHLKPEDQALCWFTRRKQFFI